MAAYFFSHGFMAEFVFDQLQSPDTPPSSTSDVDKKILEAITKFREQRAATFSTPIVLPFSGEYLAAIADSNPAIKQLIDRPDYRLLKDLSEANRAAGVILSADGDHTEGGKDAYLRIRTALALKYHSLLTNKSLNDLLRIEKPATVSEALGRAAHVLASEAMSEFGKNFGTTRESILVKSSGFLKGMTEAVTLAELSILLSQQQSADRIHPSYSVLYSIAENALTLSNYLLVTLPPGDSKISDELMLLAQRSVNQFLELSPQTFPLSPRRGTLLFQNIRSLVQVTNNIVSSFWNSTRVAEYFGSQIQGNLGGFSLSAKGVVNYLNSQLRPGFVSDSVETRVIDSLLKTDTIRKTSDGQFEINPEEPSISIFIPGSYVHEMQHRAYDKSGQIVLWTARRFRSLPKDVRVKVAKSLRGRSLALARDIDDELLGSIVSNDVFLDRYLRAQDLRTSDAEREKLRKMMSDKEVKTIQEVLTEYFAWGTDSTQRKFSPLDKSEEPSFSPTR